MIVKNRKVIRKDNIQYGTFKVYEYSLDVFSDEGEEEKLDVLNESQCEDIFNNAYDVIKVHINMYETEEDEAPDAVVEQLFYRNVYSPGQAVIYSTPVDDELKYSMVIIAFDPSTETFDHTLQEVTLQGETE